MAVMLKSHWSHLRLYCSDWAGCGDKTARTRSSYQSPDLAGRALEKFIKTALVKQDTYELYEGVLRQYGPKIGKGLE